MNKMITKAVAAVAVVLSLGAVTQAAEAHVNWSIGINVPAFVGGPAYYPAPVYVQPAPVYYAPPPPVYYAPRPIYYQQPAPVYYRAAPRYMPAPVYSPRGHWDRDGYFDRR